MRVCECVVGEGCKVTKTCRKKENGNENGERYEFRNCGGGILILRRNKKKILQKNK